MGSPVATRWPAPAPAAAHLLDVRERELLAACALTPQQLRIAAHLWLAQRRLGDAVDLAREDVRYLDAGMRISPDRPATRVQLLDALGHLCTLLDDAGLNPEARP